MRSVELCDFLFDFWKNGEKRYGAQSVAAQQRRWLYIRTLFLRDWERSLPGQGRHSYLECSEGPSGCGLKFNLLTRAQAFDRKRKLAPVESIFPHNRSIYIAHSLVEHDRTINPAEAAHRLPSFPTEYPFVVDLSGRILVHPSPLSIEDSLTGRGRKQGRIVHPMFSAPTDNNQVLAAGEISFFASHDGTYIFFLNNFSGHYRGAQIDSYDLACIAAENIPDNGSKIVLFCYSNGCVVF